MKNFGTSLLLCIVFLFSSCATLFTQSKQSITFESEGPEKAAVYDQNGVKKGETPLTIKVRKNLSRPTYVVKAEGYETSRIELESTLQPVSILNLFNVLGWGIDAATGKLMKYDNTYYLIEMEKKDD